MLIKAYVLAGTTLLALSSSAVSFDAWRKLTTAPPASTLQPSAEKCSAATADKLNQELTPWLRDQAAKSAFSGVVLVSCEGKTIYSGAYGMANRTTKLANTVNTRFNLGSMNKMWTAVAIAQLVEQGKIDLDAPLGKYLPDLPNKQVREQVRVRNLLSHTSGLNMYFKRGFLRDKIVVNKMSDYLRFFIEDTLDFAPGERMQYSNSGYALLGLLIEQISGTSFYDYMQKNVIARAGMSHAVYADVRSLAPDMAIGYALPPGATEEVENTTVGLEMRAGPAGGAYASATDIVAFSRALWSGKLMKPELVQLFTTGKVEMGPSVKYAYGFGEETFNGWRQVGHNGGGPGIGSEFVSYPDQGIDVVVLTNIEMPTATSVRVRIGALLTGGVPNKPMRLITRPPANNTR